MAPPITPLAKAAPANVPVILSAADEKRRRFLTTAKERNEEIRKKFEQRVHSYFATGIEAERKSMAAASTTNMKKKDQEKLKLESGMSV